MSGKITLTSKALPPPIGVWSHAIQVPAGRSLLFPSGFTSRDSAGNVVAPNDIEGQTRQILENMKAFLAEVGATLEDVVKMIVFVTDLTGWEKVHAVRREYFPVDPPASTLVQVTSLVEERHKIEIEVVVLLPE